MTDYGTVESAVKPEPLVIDEYSVWIHTNVVPIEREGFSGFSYHMVQYSKDEYIRLMSDTVQTAGAQITDLQLALCELYEGVN